MKIDANDPRDPSDVMVEEGVHPHPGPRPRTAKRSTRPSLGKWLALATVCIGASGANAHNKTTGIGNYGVRENLKLCGNISHAGMSLYCRCSFMAARTHPCRSLGVAVNGKNLCTDIATAKGKYLPKVDCAMNDHEADEGKRLGTDCTRTWNGMAYDNDKDALGQTMEVEDPPWECGPACFLSGNLIFTACVMALSWARRDKLGDPWPPGRGRTVTIMKAKRTGQGQPRLKDERLRRRACLRKRLTLLGRTASTRSGPRQTIPICDHCLQHKSQQARGGPRGKPRQKLSCVQMERCPRHPPEKGKEVAPGKQATRPRGGVQHARAGLRRTPRARRWRGLTLLCWLLVLAMLVRTTNAVGEDRVPPVETEAGYNLLWNRTRRILYAHNTQEESNNDDMEDTHSTHGCPETLREHGGLRERQSNVMRLITANIHAMQPRAEEVALRDADVVAVQETKLAAHAIRDMTDLMKNNRWRFVHGKPCAPAGRWKSRKRTKAAIEANRGEWAL